MIIRCKTGNGLYWITFHLSLVYPGHNDVNRGDYYNNIASCSCFGSSDFNSYVDLLFRSGNPEDPWINPGIYHGEVSPSLGYPLFFWGENNFNLATDHLQFKNANGGILAFVREPLSPSSIPTNKPTNPTSVPTIQPTSTSSSKPSVSPSSNIPSSVLSLNPTILPSALPSSIPTFKSTVSPSSDIPSISTSSSPTITPSITPAIVSSSTPTVSPSSVTPTSTSPTIFPSIKPSSSSTSMNPTEQPSQFPDAYLYHSNCKNKCQNN